MAVTAAMTVFTIARNCSARVARAVLGTHDEAIAVTDRYGSYDWIAGTHRQVCWSHLRRDFQAMIDRGGAAEPIGRRLLRLSDRLFRWWDRLEEGEVHRERFGAAMGRLRRQVEAALREGARCGCGSTSGSCAEILRVEESLWTFARVEGVSPTNNSRGSCDPLPRARGATGDQGRLIPPITPYERVRVFQNISRLQQ